MVRPVLHKVCENEDLFHKSLFSPFQTVPTLYKDNTPGVIHYEIVAGEYIASVLFYLLNKLSHPGTLFLRRIQGELSPFPGE